VSFCDVLLSSHIGRRLYLGYLTKAHVCLWRRYLFKCCGNELCAVDVNKQKMCLLFSVLASPYRSVSRFRQEGRTSEVDPFRPTPPFRWEPGGITSLKVNMQFGAFW